MPLAAYRDRLGAVQVKRSFVALQPVDSDPYSAMARRQLHDGWVIMDFPLSSIDCSRLSSVVRSRPAPAGAGDLQEPLDYLRALARQDLSPFERAHVDQEIHAWEQHSRLKEWRCRHSPSIAGE